MRAILSALCLLAVASADDNLQASAQLLESPVGEIYVKTLFAGVDLMKYYAKSGLMSANGTLNSATLKSRVDNLLDAACQGRLARRCLDENSCLVEEEVGSTINASHFMNLLEIQSALEESVWTDLGAHFDVGQSHPCGSTEGALFSEASTERQWRAVSAVSTIESAAALSSKAAATSSGNSKDFQEMWQAPCAVLGCDSSSYGDVGQALLGHGVELVEVEASADVLRRYVRAMRGALASTRVILGSAATDSEVATKRGTSEGKENAYGDMLKKANSVASGALSLLAAKSSAKLLRSSFGTNYFYKHRRRRRGTYNGQFKQTWRVAKMAGLTPNCLATGFCYFQCYGMCLFRSTTLPAFGIGMWFCWAISQGMAVDDNWDIGELLFQEPVTHGCNPGVSFSLNFGMFMGVMVAYGQSGMKAGIAGAADFAIARNVCAGTIKISLTVSVIGMFAFPGYDCMFCVKGWGGDASGRAYGCWIFTMFSCSDGIIAGLSLYCCWIKPIGGQTNCGKAGGNKEAKKTQKKLTKAIRGPVGSMSMF